MKQAPKSENQQIAMNLIANIVNTIVSMGISFFLTPYIVNNVGSSAYGFVSLGNQVIGYIDIVVVALNSMASRFVTIKMYEGKDEEARTYFSSVFFSNLFVTCLLIVPITLFVLFLEYIIQIPTEIVIETKLLWALIFANFGLSLVGTVFSIATYAKNRLDLSSRRSIEANLLRAGVLVVLYVAFRPSIIYIGIGSIITSLYVLATNMRYTRQLLPNMQISRKYFNLAAVKELISSGMWNSLTRLSTTLLAGLDLIITNLYVGAEAMGVLAVAKTLPNAVKSLLGAIPGAFTPQFIIDYAKGDTKKLLKDIDSAIKITGTLVYVPLVGLAVFGRQFFSLWVPEQNAQLLQILSILTVAATFVTAPIQPLYNIYTVTNKVKMESISVFIQGVLSTIVVFAGLALTKDWDVEHIELYIIAGTSTFFGIVRSMTFTPLYAAHCLKVKKLTFYKPIFRSLCAFVFSCGIEYAVSLLMPEVTWFYFFLFVAIASLIGLMFNVFVVLNREDRNLLLSKIFKRKGR